MCGLVGLICKSKYGFNAPHRDIFKQMLFVDTLRGADATGVFMVNKYGNFRGVKKAVPAAHLIHDPKFDEHMKDFIFDVFAIGHNRKATIGDKTISDNAHPFMAENLILVHNGTLSNHESLGIKEASIDSEAIVHSFAKIGVEETLNKINGAYALIWYNIDEKKMYFARNSQRPLWMIKTSDIIALSSEPGLAYWIMNRNGKTVDAVEEVKVNTLYSSHVDTPGEIQEEALEITPPFVYGGGVGHRSGTYGTGNYSGSSYKPRSAALSPQELQELEVLFYTSEDLSSMGVFNLIKSGDRIMFKCDSCVEVEGVPKEYAFTGKLVNIDPKVSDVHVYGKSYREIEIGDTFYGGVVSVTTKHPTENIPAIQVRQPQFAFCKKTLNGVHISYKMFDSPFTERYCQQCLTEVDFGHLDTLYAEISSKDNILRFEHKTCADLASC